MRYHQKSFDSAMQSIGKPKLLNNRVGKSLIKSRTLDISRYNKNNFTHSGSNFTCRSIIVNNHLKNMMYKCLFTKNAIKYALNNIIY